MTLNQLMLDVNQAILECRERAGNLPALPSDGHCPVCNGAEYKTVSIMEQSCSTQYDPDEDAEDAWMAITGGWDDMNDRGTLAVTCTRCGEAFAVPEDLDWS